MSVVEVILSLVFFYDNLSRLRCSVPPPPVSCCLHIPFVPQAAGNGLVLRRSEMPSLGGRGALERVTQAPCELTS